MKGLLKVKCYRFGTQCKATGGTFKGWNLVGILQVTKGWTSRDWRNTFPSFSSPYFIFRPWRLCCHTTSYPTTGPKAKEAILPTDQNLHTVNQTKQTLAEVSLHCHDGLTSWQLYTDNSLKSERIYNISLTEIISVDKTQETHYHWHLCPNMTPLSMYL